MAERILVKHVNWLGDVIMTQPALRAIRRAEPHARLSVLIKSELAGLFAGAPWIDEILPYRIRPGLAGLRDQAALVADLRSRRFDLAVLFPDSFRPALWTALAGIPRRVGYDRDGRGWLLTDAVPRTPASLTGHQVHYRLNLLRQALGYDGSPDDYGVEPAKPNLARMQDWLAAQPTEQSQRWIALAPGAAYGPAKQWPVDRFAELIDLLRSRYAARCVLVGSPGERSICEQIATRCRAGAAIAAGETDTADLLALLSLCDAFAGNDSGAMHAAGVLGIPTVGIFGSTNPDRTSPLGPRAAVQRVPIECSPCLERTCQFGHYRCLTEIHPDSVADTLGRLAGW